MDRDLSPAGDKTRRRWLAEGVLILLSVALGYFAAQFAESRADRRLGDRALASLADEIEENFRVLEPLVPVHEAWVTALAGADSAGSTDSGIDVLFGTRPALPPGTESPFPALRQGAWDAAVSGDAFRLIDYDLATALSEIYRAQEQVGDNVNRLANGPISATDTYDPARRAASVRLLWLTVADILAAERALLNRYQDHLPALRAAASAGHAVAP